MSTDEAPWLPIAKDILAGSYDNHYEAYIDSLWIGLHNINHPTCIQATEHLRLLLVKFSQGHPPKRISTPHQRFTLLNK